MMKFVYFVLLFFVCVLMVYVVDGRKYYCYIKWGKEWMRLEEGVREIVFKLVWNINKVIDVVFDVVKNDNKVIVENKVWW